MISVSDVHFSYPRSDFALTVSRLDVAAGEAVALVGPSGSGKTTLLQLVAGILVPGRGVVQVGARSVSQLEDAQRRRFRLREVGCVFQEFELLEYLDVRENILLPFRLHPQLRVDAAARREADAVAASLALEEKLSRYPRTLSTGEKQRVAVCRALVTSPRVLLADEPTSNLDATSAAHVVDTLLRSARERGAAVLVLTHDTTILKRFDRTISIDTLNARAAS